METGKCVAMFAVLTLCGVLVNVAQSASPLVGEVKKIDGTAVDLGKYKGKVVLVVNVASQCGATPQYAGLQKLYDKYKEKGLVVLGFPANEFGKQEPGSDSEIGTFCTSKYGVTFDMFSKVVVKGPGQCMLYKTLTETANPAGDISWNFEKFLIGRDGKIVGRYKTAVTPEDPKITGAVEAELGKAG